MNATARSSSRRSHPIGPDDVVSVRGRYLVKQDGSRFFLKGIAFPVALGTRTTTKEEPLNLTGWNEVLEQLADLTDINTVRVYRMDCDTQDYSLFFHRAAELGIYVVVPLTAPEGGGVLDRDKPAPDCYHNSSLYDFGRQCLDQYLHHPNALAGVIGNEVMNTLDAWKAAPCLKAYARDLKQYMAFSDKRSLPLLYAAQHDSMSAEILPEEAMKLTLDYLACTEDDDEDDGMSTIDLFGINVESWCSSLQTFELNEDGVTVSDYYALWKTLHNTSVPLIFSEMGCGKNLFNRDNGLEQQVRNWKQVPVVLNQMADTFSGFFAYTYYGNPLFDMMETGTKPWNGVGVLEPSQDFDNFQEQLHDAMQNSTIPNALSSTPDRPTCSDAREALQRGFDIALYSVELMPSYFQREDSALSGGGKFHWFGWRVGVVIAAAVVVAVAYYRRLSKRDKYQSIEQTVLHDV